MKDGNYTDEFVSQVHKTAMNSDQGKVISDFMTLDKNSETYADDLVNIIKKHAKFFEIDNPDTIVKNGSITDRFAENIER